MRKVLTVLLVALVVLALVPVAVIAAGGAFVDDDDSIFESHIEWLATTGVTQGCNPPTNDRFCPDDNVTRGQMAAFMRRFAQYLDAEDGQVAAADYAVNAGTVGGLSPGAMIRINGAMTDTPIDDFTSATWTDILTAQIEAPVDGVLFVVGSVGLGDDTTLGGNAWIQLRLTIDGVATHSDEWGYSVELTGDVNEEPFSSVAALNAAVAVSSGQHTIGIQAKEVGAGTYIYARSVSAIFSAFGGGVQAIPVAESQPSNNN